MRITAIYPNHEGSRFDAAYYTSKHKALAYELLGPMGLEAIQIQLGISSLDGAPPPFWAISEMIFKSAETFASAMEAHGEALFLDAENYTNITPFMQISETA